MKQQSFEIRVKRLKDQIDGQAKNPDYKFVIERVTPQAILELRALENYPPDMLLILDQIGCMRNYGWRDCAIIDWWKPCPIDCAKSEDRCAHELSDSNFTNPASLLFFAWDCDAKCYFYNTAVTPWRLVVCDGLELSLYNQDREKNPSGQMGGWDGRVDPWEEEGSGDALSVIEKWAGSFPT